LHRFDDVPSEVSELQAEGMEIYLLATRSGIVKELVGLESIRALPSFNRVDMFIQPGSFVSPTVDYYNRLGTVVLINTDKQQLEIDCKLIRQLEVEHKIIGFV